MSEALEMRVQTTISEGKEIFLAICMIAGFVGEDTIKIMKKDMGDIKVRRTIIYLLAKKKYISKLGNHSTYEYIITSEGIDYLERKCPDKYNYDFYRKKKRYGQAEKKRGRKLAMVLYELYKENISITNHTIDVIRIIRGRNANISSPFFVPTIEFANAHSRLVNSLGSRMLGVIVTETRIVLVYNPSTRSKVYPSNESEIIKTITSIFRQTQLPYSKPNNIELLFMFRGTENLVSSFLKHNPEEKSHSKTTTLNFYENNVLKNSYVYMIGENPYRLYEILDDNYMSEVTAAFCRSAAIDTHVPYGADYTHMTGVYFDKESNEEFPTYSLWTMSPTAFISALNFINTNKYRGSQKIVLMCYEEQNDWIKKILKSKQVVADKFLLYLIPYQKVKELVTN